MRVFLCNNKLWFETVALHLCALINHNSVVYPDANVVRFTLWPYQLKESGQQQSVILHLTCHSEQCHVYKQGVCVCVHIHASASSTACVLLCYCTLAVGGHRSKKRQRRDAETRRRPRPLE